MMPSPLESNILTHSLLEEKWLEQCRFRSTYWLGRYLEILKWKMLKKIGIEIICVGLQVFWNIFPPLKHCGATCWVEYNFTGIK